MSGLESIKPGDTVIAAGNRMGLRRVLAVERVTKTQIVTADGSRWRAKDGKRVSNTDTWFNEQIEPATAEMIEDARREAKLRSLRRRLAAVKWEEIADEAVIAAAELLRGEK